MEMGEQYIVKRGHGSASTNFSKEPLNLTNLHSRKVRAFDTPQVLNVS